VALNEQKSTQCVEMGMLITACGQTVAYVRKNVLEVTG
jgi:hypothetical protein